MKPLSTILTLLLLWLTNQSGYSRTSWSTWIHPQQWSCIAFPNKLLMVILPNSFATESKSRIQVTLQQQVDSSQHDFWQSTYSLMASQGNHELTRRSDSRIYFEVPLCRWDWEISLFARDNMGGARRLMPFPYLVEFPVRSLYFPTDCEGARDFHGWSEVLYANSNQGTLLATREFQSRYWLMNCQENEFMAYIRNRQMDMRQLDSLTSNHLVDHMITC